MMLIVYCSPVIGRVTGVAVSYGTSMLAEAAVGAATPTMIVSVNVVVPTGFVTPTVTAYVPLVVGVPEMVPEPASRVRPGGRPLAVYPVGAPVAWIVYPNGTPLVASTGPGTTIVGALCAIDMVIARLPVPVPLVAVRFTLNVPGAKGAPLMMPVAELMASPGGRPVAPKLVAPLVAVTW